MLFVLLSLLILAGILTILAPTLFLPLWEVIQKVFAALQ